MTTAISRSLLREVARLFIQSQSRSEERNSKMNSQCNLLAELERSGTLAMTELGRRVGREKSWVSRSVDALATRGLVVKEPNPADSRKWLVTLTDEGFQSVNHWNAALDDHAVQLLACLSERDRAAVEKSLLLLLTALREDQSVY